jgi:hypothetical protein
MSFLYGGEVNTGRFTARRRDLASSDIFGAMASPARTARQEAAQAVPSNAGSQNFGRGASVATWYFFSS